MGVQSRTYRNLELDCPLPLRSKAKNPQHMYYDWQKLLNRSDVRSQVLPLREEVFQKYENLVATKNQTVVQHLAQHWNNLLEDLKQGEPHSFPNYHVAIQRAPMYICLGMTKGNNWLPLIFQPPILMWPLMGCRDTNKLYDETAEEAMWDRLENMKGFYWNLAIRGTR